MAICNSADEPVQLPRIEASWMNIYDNMKYLQIKVRKPSELPFDVDAVEVRVQKFAFSYCWMIDTNFCQPQGDVPQYRASDQQGFQVAI